MKRYDLRDRSGPHNSNPGAERLGRVQGQDMERDGGREGEAPSNMVDDALGAEVDEAREAGEASSHNDQATTATFGRQGLGEMADGGQPDQQQNGFSNVPAPQAHLHQPPPPPANPIQQPDNQQLGGLQRYWSALLAPRLSLPFRGRQEGAVSGSRGPTSSLSFSSNSGESSQPSQQGPEMVAGAGGPSATAKQPTAHDVQPAPAIRTPAMTGSSRIYRKRPRNRPTKHVCAVCGRSFDRKSRLQNHIDKNHPPTLLSHRPKNFGPRPPPPPPPAPQMSTAPPPGQGAGQRAY